ncbi:MAG: hypothetical protein WCG79_09835 [Verrucomicrobiota bacterium]|jgi:hypothetical protein
MSAVDENIVREFFELHGFLVCQRRKYIVQTRQKTGNEEVDLIVLNPVATLPETPLDFEITPAMLRSVARAVVAVKGWHTEVFAPGLLTHQPKIFRFVEPKAVEEARRLIGADGLLKILVIPGLPRDAKMRERSIELLRAKGVDGVISFRAILQDLLTSVKTNRNYEKSDLLQILRLLKNYDLLKEPQLELRLRRKQ